MIQSTDDLETARAYPGAELADFELYERRKLLRENRAMIMDWICLSLLK
tara:strand:- start:3048 stop:3194 length:147 start_codon:yes stop_codon:yes gene_type:complete